MSTEQSRALDAQVAERVMGIKLPKWLDVPHGLVTLTSREIVPLYSTDIAAAWLVVERLTPVYRVSVHQFFQQWQCTLERRDGKARMPIGLPHDGDASANAVTAPEAICRAALAAMEGSK